MINAIRIAFGAIGLAGLVFWRHIERWLDRPTTGATKEYAVELRAMRNAPVAPELVSDTEADLNWALAWHNFERSMLDEIEKVFAPILVAAAELEDFDEVRELVAG